MISLYVLEPPSGADRDHRSTRFIADRFNWLAFLFPGLWLLWKRCWLTGAVVLGLQIAAGRVAELPGLSLAGMLTNLALALVIGLEGHHILVKSLRFKCWTLQDVVVATDLASAEAAYFANLESASSAQDVPPADWSKLSPAPQAAGWTGQALGLFDHDGGR
ncbi:DUF2628 domain-containing protein [Rhizobium oryzicola]|uniref:DUF2628 domain-containing protein n=1 Tax=Rhizobium oryzicola TaxID=1232668 RepID=A0ABT8T321_9HYPH|nr:DUF2628 domain-containing protein [Rhizobium oryzicola]MDO1584688.1 DUF2628 domain-containing protein [Rhizobium oryzicola]